MTTTQSKALWELCRQGYPVKAYEAEERWDKGEQYQLDWQVKVSREIMHLIEQSNWEVCHRT
jgi:hypothetical protein